MNRPIDVIDVLRQANPVPVSSSNDETFPTVTELHAIWRALPTEPATVERDRRSTDQPRRWPMYAAATALVAGVAALFLVPPNPEEPVEPVAPVTTITAIAEIATESPFVGVWVSTDSDGSFQSMKILKADDGQFEMVVSDDFATVCQGAPSTMTGVGQFQTVDTLIFPEPALTCDNRRTPEIDGAELDQELANLTFRRDSVSDELVDSFDVTWQRATFDSAGRPLPPEGSPTSARPIVSQLIDAVNEVAADESLDEASLPDVFSPDATINAFDGWGDQLVSEPGVLAAWIEHFQAWGYEVSAPSCAPEGEQLTCTVRARWQTISAEADETWTVVMDGKRIQALSLFRSGERFGDPVLAMSLGELGDWETWLRATSPDTADRLLVAADPEPALPVVPRYDPSLASEIAASIRDYLDQRPAGDDITVTPDLVDFGDRLVGSTGAVARAGGRTYVLAGRYVTESDRFSPPETAILAAFDDVGAELWRTELDGHPQLLEAVAGDVWVMRIDMSLVRIDSSTGDVLDETTIGEAFAMTSASGSVWIATFAQAEHTLQLVRVGPDLSVATADLPSFGTGALPVSGPTEGAGAVWVPLAAGGLARIDPETMETTVISAEELGHEALHLAFDGPVAYVASSSQVTSIVDGKVRATASVAEISFIGRIDDSFGVLGPNGRFVVLVGDDPMMGEERQVSTGAPSGPLGDINGEPWFTRYEDNDLQRLQLTP